MKPGSIDRRSFVLRGLAAGTAAAIAPVAGRAEEPKELTTAASAPAVPVDVPPFALLEASIASLSAAQADGRYTARKLVELCLERVEAVDRGGPKINSIIELNPDALAIADALDAERKAKGARGPMHGIPILLKDNIGTADRMRTSAGSLALAESTPLQDAFLVERLRAAGAVILGKTNLSEWANIRSTRSTSGWSGRGGLTRNPHVLDRSTSGSSSGSGAAVAAAIVPVAVGSETDGSIVSPSSICGIVGLKPTVGLVSRSGIIPISSTQDTAGPMARSVEDAAILLGVLAGVDPRDAATGQAKGKIELDYRRYLDPKGLSGRRIGVARALAGFHPDADRAFEEALGVLKKAGAILVDPVPLPTNGKFDDAEMEVLLFELKAEMEKYLSSLGPKAPARTLADLVAFNEKNRDREMPWFGQELFEKAVSKGPLTDRKYRKALADCRKLAATDGLEKAMNRNRLDALVSPSNGPAWTLDLVNGDHYSGGNSSFPAVAGWPTITVPMAFTHELPLGLTFTGHPFGEGPLLRLAYAFEQATTARRVPRFLPTMP